MILVEEVRRINRRSPKIDPGDLLAISQTIERLVGGGKFRHGGGNVLIRRCHRHGHQANRGAARPKFGNQPIQDFQAGAVAKVARGALAGGLGQRRGLTPVSIDPYCPSPPAVENPPNP